MTKTKKPIVMKNIVMEDYINYCSLQLHLGRGSLPNEKAYFIALSKWMGNKLLTRDTVESFLLHKKETGSSNSNLNKYIHLLRHIGQYLRYKNLGGDEFIRDFKAYAIYRPPIEILSVLQIEDIVKTHIKYGVFHGKDRTEYLNKVNTTAILFLGVTGCRFGEMAGLPVKDVNLAQGKVIFTETKNGTYRFMYITEPLISRIAELIEKKSPTDLVFTTSLGGPLRHQDFNQDLKRRCELAGIPNPRSVHAHIFRHSFIVELLTRGVPITVVGGLVGHKDIQSTNYYFTQLEKTMREGVYRHPLVRQGISPTTIITTIAEYLENQNLQDDSRLSYKIEKGSNSLSFTLFVR